MSDRPHDLLARWALPGLLALFVLSFVGLDRGLWTPDEPREAEIGREMLLTPGVVPTLNGVTFIEKPPLYYWLVAGAYRLAGGPVPAAARAVSVAASYLTLLAVFYWGRRAQSTALGLVAVVMLGTSLQFVLTGHWILVDPLLMLFTTIGAWSAWELLQRNGRMPVALVFYVALALALWTKGLIGPVLVGAGIGAYLLVTRRFPWRTLRPGLGFLVLAGATGVLALAIFRTAGREALWEWAWVNHVLRFVDPKGTGHIRPLHYYLLTVPFAVLPWLVPLADALRPASWRDRMAEGDLRRYCLVVAGGMLVVLTASATKRGIYLMPVLPLMCMGFAVSVLHWQSARSSRAPGLGRWWNIQATLLGICAVAPPIAVWVYLRQADVSTIACLILGVAMCAVLAVIGRRGEPGRGLVALGVSALLAATSCLALAPRVLDPQKDMAPFMEAVSQRLPPGEAVHALGADETMLAIVPFVTGRPVIELRAAKPGSPALAEPPNWVLVQTKGTGRTVPELGAVYVLVLSHNFGPERNFSLWRRSGS